MNNNLSNGLKKIFFLSLVILLLGVTFVSAANYDKALSSRLKGKLLLATEDKGRIWYVSPNDGKRYEVTFGNALSLFEKLALGISNKDLDLISEVKSTVTGNRLRGKLLLQVENRGRIWYIDTNGMKHEVTWGNLMSLFRRLALGITNGNLNKIEDNGLASGKILYINQHPGYGFSMRFPEDWLGYVTTVQQESESNITYFKFGMEKQTDMFTIAIFTKEYWQNIVKETGPKPTFITQNDTYVFAYSGAQDYVDEYRNLAKQVPDIINTLTLAQIKSNNTTCQQNSKYFVVIRKTDTTDFLIKTKTDANQNISCEYNVNQGDFEIKDQIATLFYALTDNFLMLDTGTAPPPRALTVYNLNTFKEIFNDSFYYNDFVSYDNDVIQYWSPTTRQVTIDNCPKLFSEYYGSGIIDMRVNVDLSTLVREELGETRCHYIQ